MVSSRPNSARPRPASGSRWESLPSGSSSASAASSTVWGLAFLLGTLSMVLAGATDSRQLLLRLVVPFGALAAAFTYSEREATSGRGHPGGVAARPPATE